MAGVSGIGGSGGPRNISPPDHDDDKRSDSSQFGGHNIVYGNDTGEQGPRSIEERAQLLIQSGFQVHNPEELEARSSVSQSGGTKSGAFGRMWNAVKGIFGRKASKESVTEISDPIIPGYKKYGKRLPDARAIQMHFQSQEGSLGIDSGDTDIADLEKVAVGDLVDVEGPSKSESSSKTSGTRGLAKRVRGWWDYANRKEEEPLDGRVGLSLSELQDMAEKFTKMMNETDNEGERALFMQYRDTYKGYIHEMLTSGATSPSDKYSLLDGSFDDTAAAKHVDQLGEAIFLDSNLDLSLISKERLVSMIDTGHNADSVLGEVSPEVQRVLEEANNMRSTFDAGISENVTPELRERIRHALDMLLSGIRNVLTVIRNSLVGLSRLVRIGLRALGEFVRRQGSLREGHYHVSVNDDDFPQEVGDLLTQYIDSNSSDSSEDNVVIPRSVVEAWTEGIPEVVYMTRVGHGFGEDGEQREEEIVEHVYEEISVRNFLPRTQQGNLVYQTMHPMGLENVPLVEDTVYEDMSGQQGNAQEESLYSTPRTSPIYDSPRNDLGLYDIPRPFPTRAPEEDAQGYMIPNVMREGDALGVTPGFGNALVSVSSAAYFDRLIEENDKTRERIWTTASSADFGLEEGRRLYSIEGRPLPPLPPLETPPPSPYGNNRAMQLLRQLQSGLGNAWRNRRK
ncbi:hypothetical protein [Chlamydia psittaci]|uniref:hypothetical protein n=1 Tax=Chlamydia psittaci TaxID=83554 RepID=UPI00027E1552|nr:hypothetical protein [Chlamydia psittaci]AFS24380.1 hypothetical protein B602_0298 [Chlamydia psittaci M56]